MTFRVRIFTSAGALVALLAVLLPTVALAHARRQVGAYSFLVGWVNEPPILGESNGLDLTITDASGKPILGAEKSLKVAIAYGGGTPKAETLTPQEGQDGKYTFDVIPTKAGSYSFIFSGSLNGAPINQRFDSGPNTFEDVDSPASLEFPVAVPAASDLAQQTQAASAAAQAASQRATLFGLAGVAVGLIGLIVAVVALIARARPPEADVEGADTAPAPSRPAPSRKQ